jgi:hypothetical protein
MPSAYENQDLDALVAEQRPYGDDDAAQIVVPLSALTSFVRDRALDPSDARERGFVSVFGPLANNGDTSKGNSQPRINIQPTPGNSRMASAVDSEVERAIQTRSYRLLAPDAEEPLGYKITKGLRIPYVYVSNERLVEANIFILYSGSGEL